MPLSLFLFDDQYPKRKRFKKRVAVRAFVEVKEGVYLLHEVKRDDAFGNCDYFELPGGKREKGESSLFALRREVMEETGYEFSEVQYLGFVRDFYNLLGWENITQYFLVSGVAKIKEPHFVSQGDRLIQRTLSVSKEEAIVIMTALPLEGIPLLVKRRELPFWRSLEK